MKTVLLFSIFLLCVHSLELSSLVRYTLRGHDEIESPEDIEEAKQRLYEKLFPYRNETRRRLYGEFIPNSVENCPNSPSPSHGTNKTVLATKVPCIKCLNMKQCTALNGLTIQEVYYPNNLDLRGTCVIIDSLGLQMSNDIFGTGRTFRDTPQCREIVMQYLCLFWGSDNPMYTNCCILSEQYNNIETANNLMAPRPPCRSFCVQVAQVCANDGTFMNLCMDIKCPPVAEQCTPDPTVNGENLESNIGCELPFIKNPYAPKNAASATASVNALTTIFGAILCSYLFLFSN